MAGRRGSHSRCGREGRPHFDLTVDTNFLQINMEQDELEEGMTNCGLPPLLLRGDPNFVLDNKSLDYSLCNLMLLP